MAVAPRLRRAAGVLVATVIALVVLVVVACGALALRLAQGPIALDRLVPYLEEQMRDPQGRFAVDIGGMALAWVGQGAEGRIDLRATQVRSLNAAGATLAEVPEVGIGLSLPRLFEGRIRPTRLELIGPRVTVVRRPDFSVGFDLGEASDPAAVPSEDGGATGAGLLETLRRPADPSQPLGLMATLTVTGAEVRLVDQVRGGDWHASRADVTLVRGPAGISGNGRVALDLGGGTMPVQVTLHHALSDASTALSVRFANVVPASLAGLMPDAAPLAAVTVPLEGRLDLAVDSGFRMRRLGFDLTGGEGGVELPAARPEPFQVRRALLRGGLTFDDGLLKLDAVSLTVAGPDGQDATLGLAGTVVGAAGLRGGSVTATLAAGGATAIAAVQAEPVERGGMRVSATLTGVEPARLSGFAPALAPLRLATLPLSGTLAADFDRDFEPRNGRVALTAGPGRVALPDLLPEPLAVAGITLTAEADAAAGRLRVENAAIDLGGPTLHAAGTVDTANETLAADVTVTARAVPFDDLHRYWPEKMGRVAHEWVTRNLRAGTVHEATLRVAGSGPLARADQFEPHTLRGTIDASDVTIHYFRPLPPVTGVTRARADIEGTVFTIHTEGGRIDDIEAGNGKVVITKLGSPREDVEVDMPVRGPARTVLQVLDHPPLGYPAKLDMDPKKSRGMVEAQLHFGFPLLADLKVEDIDVRVGAKLTGAGLEDVALGQAATDGTLDLDLTTKAMTVKGKAKFAGLPVTLDWKEQFDSAAKGPRTRMAIRAEAQTADVKRILFDVAPWADGPLTADLVFQIDQQKRSSLSGTLDLARTTLALEPLGWTKPPGTPAQARFVLELNKGKPVRVSGITVEGAGLKGGGVVELTPAAEFARFHSGTLTLGANDLKIEATPKAGGYAATITGPTLDARPMMKRDGKEDETEKSKPLDLTVDLGRVVFGNGRAVEQVKGRMVNDGGAWTMIELAGRAGGTLGLRFRPTPQGQEVLIEAADAGAALRALDVTDKVRGGRLKVQGRAKVPRRDAPVDGTIELYDYTLVDAPALARILNAMSIGGVAEALGGKGINFGRMLGNFRKQGSVVTFSDVRTSGSALGLTMEGDLDMDKDTANLRGTIVPVYGLNRLIGQIPVLGDLLSGGEGQGIFAATWHVEGPLGDPSVSVNPLAVLAPGFLRNLFFLGDGKTPAAPADEVPWHSRPN